MDLKKLDSRPIGLRIEKIVEENANTKTFIFRYPLGGKPGQFVMLWVPGMDEKPFSIAYDDGQEFWLTICDVGPCSHVISCMKEGDRVGIRGPMGTDYEVNEGDHLALVAGGYGAAPMYFVAKDALAKGCKVEFLVGARNEGLLLYRERVKELGEDVRLHISTDDGSVGKKGFVTHLLEDVLKETPSVNKVFTCGPEIMMKFVGEIAHANERQCFMSIEKYMKCGIGVCGQCAMDDTGVLACKDGPVMDYEYVKKLPEFGKYHRDAQGAKHYF